MSFTLTSHDLGRLTKRPSDSRRATELHKRIVQESFGWPQAWSLWQNVPMTPWGYPLSSAPFARGASGTPTDRQGGRDIPLYWNEVDLRGFRVLSKFLTDTNQFGKGFLNRLVDYHVRKGFGWQACRRGEKKTPYPTQASPPDALVAKGQEILDEFRDRMMWPLVSREAFRRLQRDGEVFGRFGLYAGRPWFRFIAADQVGNPSGDTTTPQSFGIETDPDDVAEVLAYHVWDVADYPSGGEWIDANDVIHVKVNVDSDVKRGLPSFFPVQDNLDIVRKLLSNMLGSAQKMAAVAWREKYPTASASQVQQMIPLPAASDALGYGPGPYGLPGYPAWNGGVNGFQQGEVIKVEGNREYEEGPTAAGVTNFIEAEQAALRGAAVSFGFPEAIATGKIDDINFAAALTTGAPFAVAIEGGQFEYGCRWERRSALKVLELSYRSGRISFEEWRALDVEVEEPSPMITEPDKETARRKVMNESRVLSPQTWQLMESLDPQHEEANFKAWDEANPQQQPGYVETIKGQIAADDGNKPAQESVDDSGHMHKGKGPGGGQFMGTDGSSGDSGSKVNGGIPKEYGVWNDEVGEDRYSKRVSQTDKIFEKVVKKKLAEVTPGEEWPFPPVEVKRESGPYDLKDGHHRIEVAKRLGMKIIPATLVDPKAFGHTKPVNTFVEIDEDGEARIIQPNNESLPPIKVIVPEKKRSRTSRP